MKKERKMYRRKKRGRKESVSFIFHLIDPTEVDQKVLRNHRLEKSNVVSQSFVTNFLMDTTITSIVTISGKRESEKGREKEIQRERESRFT